MNLKGIILDESSQFQKLMDDANSFISFSKEQNYKPEEQISDCQSRDGERV